ncbi:20S proteasome subunit beta 1 [Nematocida sp. LUAm3]|nr:20S proteasome subunit beta 1 [Nematocida sp. LUAm3]KAI5176083.1 20S proteasome subunit beta 1 [Nematocida sp. LUAm2]KAI5177127.1 20S proteasome subunit beta 1 [Nematocida sp. LUAm1]
MQEVHQREEVNRGKKEGEVSLGTTIMAIRFSNGVILGADTRTSMGTYISNRVSRKITKIVDKIYTCRSGSAADTQAIAEIVGDRLQRQKYCYESENLVEDAAVIAKKIIYQNPHLLAGLIIAGVDRTGGHVFSISLGGTIIEENISIGGSGSAYITGLCDKVYRENMNEEDAINFVKEAIGHAMYRDNSSGGCIRMMVITPEETKEIFVRGNELFH